MNSKEVGKTGWFLAVAAVVVAVAWMSTPKSTAVKPENVVGQTMFKTLTDPNDVNSLQVLQFDQTSREPVRLEIAKAKDRWQIPSHSSYPADAKEHLAAAANALMDLKIIGVAPGLSQENAAMNRDVIRKFHNQYGVVDPDPAHVQASDDGVGMRITLKDKEGHDLASAILGKQVADQADQRYIRNPNNDAVYIVNFDNSKLSVKFEDWIERNLLKLNSMDLQKVQIKDYTVDLNDERAPIKFKGQLAIGANSGGDQPWKLLEDLSPDPTKSKAEEIRLVHRNLAADEELDTKKLDDLKFALDDLKIVDVDRKPGEVPADLRIKTINDAKVAKSLASRGFYPLQDPSGPEGQFQLLSNQGEISLQLNDGARYVLRFGETTGETSAASDKSKEKPDGKKDEAAPGLNRYLFVMADFNQDAIAKPALEKLPEEEKKPEPAKTPDAKPGDKKADETKPAGKDAKPDSENAKKDEAAKEKAAGDNDKKDATKKDEPKRDIKAERERIEKENKRKQEEYDAKVAAGKKHVKELNARFADWYYVISDDVYRKIHLSRADIVKKKEKKDKEKDAAGHDDHDHAGHDHAEEKPAPGPVQSLENLKKDAPEAGKAEGK